MLGGGAWWVFAAAFLRLNNFVDKSTRVAHIIIITIARQIEFPNSRFRGTLIRGTYKPPPGRPSPAPIPAARPSRLSRPPAPRAYPGRVSDWPKQSLPHWPAAFYTSSAPRARRRTHLGTARRHINSKRNARV